MTDITIKFDGHYPTRYTWIRLLDIIKQRKKQKILNYKRGDKNELKTSL